MKTYRLTALCAICAGGLMPACKDEITVEKKETVIMKPGGHAIAPGAEIASMSGFFPLIWEDAYDLNAGSLPLEGTAERLPYSGWWYPFNRGGTNVDLTGDGLTLLEKYDRAFDPPGSSAAWEAMHHGSGDSWFGHCNGFAAAASRHDEPTRAVTVGGITFQPEEIKALLAEVHMKAIPVFIGGRRCDQIGAVEEYWATRPNPQRMGICEDINPGVFHAGLANVIGRKKHVLVMDLASNNEVWNYPVFRYASSLIPVSEAEASRLITGAESSYPFNNGARNFYKAQTTVFYRSFGEREGIYGGQGMVRSAVFEYILETGASDEIVGGEWINGSVARHPDFLWIALQPLRFEAGRIQVDENSPVNPFIDPEDVIKMWAESAGYDPENPPLDIMMPTDEEIRNWGKFTNFTLTLDGSERGVAFTGKPVRVVVNRTEKLAGAVNVSVSMNSGEAINQVMEAGSGYAVVELNPPAGINTLEVSLHNAGTILESKQVYFHGVP